MKPMRRFPAVIFALLLAIAAAGQDKQPPARANGDSASLAAPLMVIDSYTHDFGEVKAGTPLRFAFKVKNQGKADLLINNVSPG